MRPSRYDGREMKDKPGIDRRDFLKRSAVAMGAVTRAEPWAAFASDEKPRAEDSSTANGDGFLYPRVFRGRQLRMISFPLGGVAAGSIGLGGRGQLINWEIFNRPNKGFRPSYSFPSIWAQAGSDGTAVLGDVPAGKATVRAWDERGGDFTGVVDVPAGGAASLAISLDGSAFRDAGHKNKYGKDYPPPDDDGNQY